MFLKIKLHVQQNSTLFFDNPHSTIKIVKDIRMLLFRKK